MNETKQSQLKKLPGVDRILEQGIRTGPFATIPKKVLIPAVRETIDSLRQEILAAEQPIDESMVSTEVLIQKVCDRAALAMAPRLKRTVNATGVVVHTNLGRSLLSPAVLEKLTTISSRYSNLEFDLDKGRRGSRYSAVEGILCELSGAESAMVVNNNAAAVLLCLDTLARGSEVVVSRGELVEIGGSFRIPDVMAKSGAILKEVGTTNRTHARDYENAIGEQTGLLLKAHTSNYSIVGFTRLGQPRGLGENRTPPRAAGHGGPGQRHPDRFFQIRADQGAHGPGIPGLPAWMWSPFSGDKLLGGPQAGIILGAKTHIERVKANPLTRALRIDKMTLAALEGTLSLYRDEARALREIPTLRMLTMPHSVIEARAADLSSRLGKISKGKLTAVSLESASKAGGGALPLLNLPSVCIGVEIDGMTANGIERWMRRNAPPIIGRIENDHFIMDPRTLQEEELDIIEKAFVKLLAE